MSKKSHATLRCASLRAGTPLPRQLVPTSLGYVGILPTAEAAGFIPTGPAPW